MSCALRTVICHVSLLFSTHFMIITIIRTAKYSTKLNATAFILVHELQQNMHNALVHIKFYCNLCETRNRSRHCTNTFSSHLQLLGRNLIEIPFHSMSVQSSTSDYLSRRQLLSSNRTIHCPTRCITKHQIEFYTRIVLITTANRIQPQLAVCSFSVSVYRVLMEVWWNAIVFVRRYIRSE